MHLPPSPPEVLQRRQVLGGEHLAVEDGHAAVELLQNGLADGVGPGADDLDLRAAVTHQKHFVHDDGVQDDQYDAVQHLIRLAEQGLYQQDGDVKEHHGKGGRGAER